MLLVVLVLVLVVVVVVVGVGAAAVVVGGGGLHNLGVECCCFLRLLIFDLRSLECCHCPRVPFVKDVLTNTRVFCCAGEQVHAAERGQPAAPKRRCAAVDSICISSL